MGDSPQDSDPTHSEFREIPETIFLPLSFTLDLFAITEIWLVSLATPSLDKIVKSSEYTFTDAPVSNP
ncbi:hypothetical protein Ciccas_004187 [Cichlidogyrus casuarinus]|uniref:Uncharacterized protein n=1 Tax=Cichlidogyrus casuarinus TaxID=1844966 RepID=A0ABD2QEJ2_9PLAT